LNERGSTTVAAERTPHDPRVNDRPLQDILRKRPDTAIRECLAVVDDQLRGKEVREIEVTV